MVKMEEITNVMEYEELAKEKLPKMVYDYYASGAEDQWTLRENRNAFSRILYALDAGPILLKVVMIYLFSCCTC